MSTETPGEVAARIDIYVTALVDMAMNVPTRTAEDCAVAVAFLGLAESFAEMALRLGQRQAQLIGSESSPGCGPGITTPGVGASDLAPGVASNP